MATGPWVLIISARWNATRHDEPQIIAALEERGARVTEVSLERLSPDLNGDRLVVECDGRAIRPDAVLNRVSEAYWLDVEPVLAAFRQLGVWVVNGDGLWTAADKWATALALQRSGLPQVPTRYVPGPGTIPKLPPTLAARLLGVDVSVAKTLIGASAREIDWITEPRTAQTRRLVQPYACHPNKIERVWVARGRAWVALVRPTGDPLKPSSMKYAGKPARSELTPALAELGEGAVSSVGLTAFGGVDVAEWLEGQPEDPVPAYVLLGDVNGSAGIGSVQLVAPELNVFGIYADAVLDDIADHT